MRTKFYIRSDTPEVTTRLAQIPGRVPRFRIWLVTSVMERNSERFEEATQIHAQAPDPLVQHRPPGQVGAGRRLGKVVGEGQAEASSIHDLPDSRSARFTLCRPDGSSGRVAVPAGGRCKKCLAPDFRFSHPARTEHFSTGGTQPRLPCACDSEGGARRRAMVERSSMGQSKS